MQVSVDEFAYTISMRHADNFSVHESTHGNKKVVQVDLQRGEQWTGGGFNRIHGRNRLGHMLCVNRASL